MGSDYYLDHALRLSEAERKTKAANVVAERYKGELALLTKAVYAYLRGPKMGRELNLKALEDRLDKAVRILENGL